MLDFDFFRKQVLLKGPPSGFIHIVVGFGRGPPMVLQRFPCRGRPYGFIQIFLRFC